MFSKISISATNLSTAWVFTLVLLDWSPMRRFGGVRGVDNGEVKVRTHRWAWQSSITTRLLWVSVSVSVSLG